MAGNRRKLTLESPSSSINAMTAIVAFFKENVNRMAAASRTLNGIASIRFAVILLVTALLAGCTSKPFNVKTQVVFPASADVAVAESNGIRMQAAVVRDEDVLLA